MNCPAIRRIGDGPIIHPATRGADESMGTNINGPSLIRVPEWLPNPLGRYYLYFAHHQGKYIRLAYADRIEGPWTIHTPGTLHREQTRFNHHIASPDVHVDPAGRQLVMYFHGCCNKDPSIPFQQITCLATGSDGLVWQAQEQWLANSYLRTFGWEGETYGISMPGRLWRYAGPSRAFELRPHMIFADQPDPPADVAAHRARHFAVERIGSTLRLFFTRIGDEPERLLYTQMSLSGPWETWQAEPTRELLRPEHPYEGADLPMEASRGGAVHRRAHALRDPACFRDADGRAFLLYCVAGESGIALAALDEEGPHAT